MISSSSPVSRLLGDQLVLLLLLLTACMGHSYYIIKRPRKQQKVRPSTELRHKLILSGGGGAEGRKRNVMYGGASSLVTNNNIQATFIVTHMLCSLEVYNWSVGFCDWVNRHFKRERWRIYFNYICVWFHEKRSFQGCVTQWIFLTFPKYTFKIVIFPWHKIRGTWHFISSLLLLSHLGENDIWRMFYKIPR